MKNDYWIIDGVVFMDVSTPLNRYKIAVLDEEDLPLINKGGRWRACRYRGDFYVVRSVYLNGHHTNELIHRVIADYGPGVLCDHKDRDTLNNRRENLRPATEAQNRRNCNKKRGTSSTFIGVSWYARRSKWRASATEKRKHIHLGFFSDEIEAARAYDAAVRHDPFANLNFPEARAA